MNRYTVVNIRYFAFIAILICIYFAASPSFASTTAAAAVSIPSNTASAISVTTIPSASCTLVRAGLTGSGASGGVDLASDSTGQVVFYAKLSGSASNDVLSLTCQSATGAQSTTQITVQVDNSAVAMPPPAPHGVSRPALPGDPLSYSQQELFSGGYGLRPDPVAAPGPYAQWVQQVTTPATLVTGAGVSMPGRYNQLGSTAWSGCITTNGGTKYEVAYAYWIVPPVTGDPGNTDPVCYNIYQNTSSLWVGMDGWTGTSDVMQTGTEQDVTRYPDCDGTGDYSYWSYYAWAEFFPYAQLQVYNVNAYDEMLGEVWLCSGSDGELNSNGGYGCFYIADESTNPVTVWEGYGAVPSVGFKGATAEWIMENPCSGSSPSSCSQVWFADYSTASEFNAYSLDTVNGWQDLASQPIDTIYLYEGSTPWSGGAGRLESEVEDITYANTCYFWWKNF